MLTFFSGFGLGTILTPVFAIYFPIEIAIAMTAVVHLLNNVFKFGLTFRHIEMQTLWRFGMPSILGAFLGAYILTQLSDNQILGTIELFGKTRQITLIKLIIAIVMCIFALIELIPYFKKLTFKHQYLSFGGLLSGFFGGLSGHQGALRSMFLVKGELTKQQFISTGIVIACLVDITRLIFYKSTFQYFDFFEQKNYLFAALFPAIIGAYIGHKMIEKVTIHQVQKIVSFGLILIAFALGFGII